MGMREHGDSAVPLAGLSLMLEPEFALAAFPLFAAGEVELVEWSFDAVWDGTLAIPDWLGDLLDEYDRASRLLGHGVTFSMFSVEDDKRQQAWLESLRQECQRRHYRHVTEHFGFMVAGDFHRGAPLPVPVTQETLRFGRDRIARLTDAAQQPVGLENLAFAFGPDDVSQQGEFLDHLLEPTDGFLLLDLHNIYCQSCNFQRSPAELIASYPTQRVRELHLSGGSWSEALGTQVRRDTHDGAVPEELFSMLSDTLKKCPNVEAVIFEHLGNELPTPESHARFQADFRRISQLVHEFRSTPTR